MKQNTVLLVQMREASQQKNMNINSSENNDDFKEDKATKKDFQEVKETGDDFQEEKENGDEFQEDEDFDKLVEDLDLYYSIDNFTEKIELDECDISISDIESLNSKLWRFKQIIKKMQIQDKTKAELSRVTKEKEKLRNEIKTMKSSESHQKSPLVMKFFKCSNCENTFSSSDGLNAHTKEHVNERPSDIPDSIQCDNCQHEFPFTEI